MKAFLMEIWDPVKDFYKMRIKTESLLLVLIPTFGGIISFFVGNYIHPQYNFSLSEFCVDVLNQILTILTLFISFSMAYLSILITSSSQNVDGLKGTESETYFLRGKPCTLYQVLASEITYTLVFEIFFLTLVLAERFLLYIFSPSILQIVLALDIALFVHVMIMMLIIVKNIYYSFWKSR